MCLLYLGLYKSMTNAGFSGNVVNQLVIDHATYSFYVFYRTARGDSGTMRLCLPEYVHFPLYPLVCWMITSKPQIDVLVGGSEQLWAASKIVIDIWRMVE